MRASCRRSESDRRALCVSPVRLRHCGYRAAGCTGACVISRLRDWRGLSMAREPRKTATTGGGLLYHHRRRHWDRIATQFSLHRSCEGPLLGGNSEWHRRSAAHGCDHDDGFQSESDGKVCNSSLSEMGGVVCHRRHALCMHRSST